MNEIEQYIQQLQDHDAAVRLVAAWKLGNSGDARAVPALTVALQDPDAVVRSRAAWKLRTIGDASAVPALIVALQDPDAVVRRTAVCALDDIGDARAMPALVMALKDADAEVRREAVCALGNVGGMSAVLPLVIALKDADADVQYLATYTLGKISDAACLEDIAAVLEAAQQPIGPVASIATDSGYEVAWFIDSDVDVARRCGWALTGPSDKKDGTNGRRWYEMRRPHQPPAPSQDAQHTAALCEDCGKPLTLAQTNSGQHVIVCDHCGYFRPMPRPDTAPRPDLDTIARDVDNLVPDPDKEYSNQYLSGYFDAIYAAVALIRAMN